jgi:hypothetical protein
VRRCHYCGLPIPDREHSVEALTMNAWAHFECWFDGRPWPRDPSTGELRPVVGSAASERVRH